MRPDRPVVTTDAKRDPLRPDDAARSGVTVENTSATDALVVLRYFGPDTNPDAPSVGDWKKLA